MNVISLIRVSTGKQAESGLGLESQRDMINNFISIRNARFIREYQEVESGKHDDIENRPTLNDALSHCVRSHAVVVVAKLDRLTRSLSMYSDIKRRGVRVVALDLGPDANELTTDIMVAVKAEERRAIAKRTKDALTAYKNHGRVSKRIRLLYPDGVPAEIAEATAGKLGASLPQCRNLTDVGRRDGAKKSAKVRHRNAIEAYGDLSQHMQEMRTRGLSLLAIAAALNAEGHTTRRLKQWNPTQVKRVLDRLPKNP